MMDDFCPLLSDSFTLLTAANDFSLFVSIFLTALLPIESIARGCACPYMSTYIRVTCII